MRNVICLMGPTASGKTDMAAHLLEVFPCEIVSVDSAMVYRGMDIGTAKPDTTFLTKAPHHLIDIREPTEAYSAAAFCHDATRLCNAILAKGKIPLLVGGTMMYFRAFQAGLSALPKANPDIRATLLQEAKTYGWPYLHEQLKAVDATTAARLHPNDAQRIQRALEVYHTTGLPLSQVLLEKPPGNQAYRFINLALFPEARVWLHTRIEKRFMQMLEMGFLKEVDALMERFDLTADMPAMRSVGYRQALAYRAGSYDYKTFCEQGVVATRRLAKRQLTWLRTWPNAEWFDPENPRCFDTMLELLHVILDNQTSKKEDE
ncbi:MAG: tRNA (adenosine(37)-N6)-dimethylallyltransferase MiaA [Legionellaceae bacterium]|nr:tRNA (adenosine(37)-N6)-dimethylallyltransferase MiaA [Legionellaceae bacterium]